MTVLSRSRNIVHYTSWIMVHDELNTYFILNSQFMASNEITIHEKNNKPFHISRGDINWPVTIHEKYPSSLYLILSLNIFHDSTALGPGYCKFRVIAYIKLTYALFLRISYRTCELWETSALRAKFETKYLKIAIWKWNLPVQKSKCTCLYPCLFCGLPWKMKLLSQNQLRTYRFICKRDKNYTCKTKAWSHSFARISENENHPGSARQSPMKIHSLITPNQTLSRLRADCSTLRSLFLVDSDWGRDRKKKQKQIWEIVVTMRNMK